MSEYGSPFFNTDSGIVLSNDSENKQRLRKAFENFWKSIENDQEQKDRFPTNISKQKAQYSLIGGPIAGALFGKFWGDAFCSQKYFYFRGFLIFLFGSIGYKYGSSIYNRYQYSLYVGNFGQFPKELQDALRSGDARYARKWWSNQ